MLVSRFALLLLLFGVAARVEAQEATVIFDEDDEAGEGYYDASLGTASGGATLDLAGPSGDRMPTETGAAFSGSEAGRLTFDHEEDGQWSLLVGAPGFGALDLSDADSLVLYLNSPAGVAETEMPRLGLEDAAGTRTALLPLDPPGRIGRDAARSGFLDGSTTDAALGVAYVDVLPAGLVRPGYPEDLTLTFADAPLDTSTAAIGVPATPARFRIDAASGVQLDFRFRDTDGDGTLSTASDYVTVLTPDADGALRPTWQVTLSGPEPEQPPGDGDAYLLAVNNGGIDAAPATWQRLAVALADFGPLGGFDLAAVRGVRFAEGGPTAAERTLWLDYVAALAYDGGPTGPPPPSDVDVRAGDEAVVLRWASVPGAASYHVYRQDAPALPFERLTTTPTTFREFADLDAENGEPYTYVLRSLAPGNVPGPDSEPLVATADGSVFDPYLDLVAERAFDYFWEEANPSNGLVKDRSTPGSASSIAAVGFGLSAITVGIDRGWVTREAGRERVRTTMEFFWGCPQGPAATGFCGYKGFFYHFLNMETGRRAGTNELSTIDTALLLGGMLHAQQYFSEDHPDAAQIRALTDSIYHRVDWTWAAPNSPLVSLGWRPESGFIGFDWRGYNEAMILYLLGLGSPTHPLPDGAWEAWAATYDGDWGTFYGYTYLSFPPLFGHQYSHLWVDFRGIQDAFMREKSAELGAPIDYFENSRRATLAQRAYSIANPRNHPNYGPDEWGLTASDVPDGYRARGAPPAQNDDGTIAPTAPGGSIAFTPEESHAALRHFYRRYRPRLWGAYGLRDAYNVRENWFADTFLGIDQGPFVIMIENLRTEAIWDAFMQSAYVQRGLERAGFTGPGLAAEDVGADAPFRLDAYPNPARVRADLRFSTPTAGPVSLHVYDVLGRRVATLVDEVTPAGEHRVVLDAQVLPSGLYIVELRTAAGSLTQKLTVLH